MRWFSRSSSAPDRRLKTVICLAAVTLLLALSLLRGIDLWRRHDVVVTAGERRAANLALILAEYLRQSFATADTALRELALRSQQIGGPEASDALWAPSLDAAFAGLSGIGSLNVIDAEGIIRHSTIPTLIGQSRRDTYVFQHLAAEGDSGLVADIPFPTTRPPFRMVIPLGRALYTADGRFAGILAATYEPAQLREVFRAVDTGPGGVVWVFHPGGFILFREPSQDNPLGRLTGANPLFAAAMAGDDSGIVNGPVEAGGVPLFSAFQRLSQPPLAVAVSIDAAALLENWWRDVFVSIAVFLILVLLTGSVLLVLAHALDARGRAELAATQAERLKALGQFTGGIAHDFNNLLSVIIGNLSELKPEANSPAAEALGEIEATAWRAAELTQRLLAFARKQPLQPKDVDLNDLVRTIEPMLTRLIGEDVTLNLRFAPQPCCARIDMLQAETALMNLCANARDAMPHGGVLTIETATAVLDENYARANADVVPGPYAQISVSDTGTGISSENLERVFEPFFTTKEVGKGTGLGLSMVYGFVRQSGGHAEIDSEPGQGTSVKLYFPRIEPTDAVVPAPSPPPRAAERGGGETILVVEDEAGLRRLANRILSDLGYRVVAAASGVAALDMTQSEHDIDLLFTDVVLPGGMNGRQLAEALLALRPNLKVLFTSGYAEDIILQRGAIMPGLHFLPKPYGKESLAAAIRATLDANASADRRAFATK